MSLELRVYFSCRPPEGITRPAGSKEAERSAEKPNESGEVSNFEKAKDP